jgi:uncharacterized protein (TIGR02147 family)
LKTSIRNLASEIRPTSFGAYCEYLSALYEEMKRRDKEYSYAAFALDLGYTAASNIHNIVTGKRRLTHKAAVNIARTLGLSSLQTRYFLLLTQIKDPKNSTEQEVILDQLIEIKKRFEPHNITSDQVDLFREWYHH